MTSRKSLQNNFGYAYRTGLRDNSLFAILNTVFLSLFFAVMPIMTFRNNTSVNRETGDVSVINFKEQFSFMFTQGMEIYRYFVLAGLIGVGLLVGITTFKFITGKKTVNVYYSLGIKRQKLFTAKYLSGLTLIALSVLLPMLVSLIANISVLGTNKFMFPAFAYLTLGMFSVAAVSYTITAMVFTLVGTVFEGALFSGILILFPEILFRCLQVLIEKLVLGTPLGTDFSTSSIYIGDTSASLTKTFENFNPLRYLSKGLFTYSLADAKGQVTSYDNGGAVAWSAPNFLPVVLWLAVVAVLFLGGMFFYKRRKAEIGGFLGKNRVMNFIGTFLVGIFGFVLTFDVMRAKGMAVAVAVGAVVFAVIYVGLSFLLLRNVRQFVKELPALPIQLAIVAVIFVFFATGYFGAANKIPETADIQSAQITMPNTNYAMTNTSYSYHYMMGLPTANTQPYGEYTNEKDIDFVRNVHEKLVAAGKTEATKLDSDFNGNYPISVKIVYKLKNGKEVLRCYYGVSAEILKELQKADETDYQQSVYKKIFKDEVKVVEMPKETEGVPAETRQAYAEYLYIRQVREGEDVRLYNKTLSTETQMELTAEQRAKLLDCLYQDLSAQTAENRYNPAETLGVISFVSSVDEETGKPTTVAIDSNGAMHEYADSVMHEQEDVFSGKSINYGQPDFFITSDMTNTVAFLKSVGYYDAMVGDKELKNVYGIQVSQMFTRSYIDDWIYYREDLACEFLSESSMDKNAFTEITAAGDYFDERDKPQNFNSSDKALMEEIRKNTVTRAMLSPTDYIVVLAYTDGTYAKTYVRADKMPESAKAGIAKNAPADSYYQ